MEVFIYSIDFNSLAHEEYTIDNAKGIVFGENIADVMDRLIKWYKEGTGIEKVTLSRIDTNTEMNVIEIIYNDDFSDTDFIIDLKYL